MKKATRKFLKKIDKQIDGMTAGTRYTMDFMSGSVTPADQKKKKDKAKRHEGKAKKREDKDADDITSEDEVEANGEQKGKQDKD